MICNFNQCEKAVTAKGLCPGHYRQMRAGEQLRPLRSFGTTGCKYPDCDRPHKSQGYCDPHVRQLRRGEKIRPIREYTMSVEERFWSKVDKSGKCWIWTASLISDYGAFQVSTRKRIYAHRYAWELFNGVPAEGWFNQYSNLDGLVLDHDNPDYGCGNPLCVNPAHLEPVDFQTNTQRKRGLAANNKSGLRGVSWSNKKKKWCVQVGFKGKNYWGGAFERIEDAEAAANALRNRLFEGVAA